MARKAKAKGNAKSPVKATKRTFDGEEISAGEDRKLKALCKSIGDELGREAFTKWLKKQRAAKAAAPEDKNAAVIAETLLKLIDDKKLRIPRGGYLVTRGRGRVVVTRAKSE